MQDNEKRTFAELWISANAVWDKVVNPIAASIVFEALRDYPLDAVKLAISEHIKDPEHGQYPPKPADILRHLQGDVKSAAMRAWSEVLGAISSVGSYSCVVFADAAIMAAICDLGGWVSLCGTDVDKLDFKRQEFERRYIDNLRHGFEPVSMLRGIFDGEPKFIGSGERRHIAPPKRSNVAGMFAVKRMDSV